MTLLIIDPGHGGADRANRGPTGYVEADGVLDISLKLRKMLADAGYSVKMTREKDETVALYSRAEMANRWKGDLLISIHSNAAADTNAGGIETFHTLVNEWNNQAHQREAKRVAEIVQRRLVSVTGLRNRGIKTRLVTTDGSPIKGKDFYAVIRRSNMAALIVEVGFHSNPREEALLKTEEFRTKAAVAIFEGIKKAYPIVAVNLTPIQGVAVATLKVVQEDLEEPKKEQENVISKSISLSMHGRPLEIDGLFMNGRNYIPVAFLRQLGYKVDWNSEKQMVEIEYMTEDK